VSDNNVDLLAKPSENEETSVVLESTVFNTFEVSEGDNDTLPDHFSVSA